MTDLVLNPLAAAFALATAEGRTARSIKDLLCDACGEGVALRSGGFCHRCADEMNTHYDATREAHAMSTDDAGDGFALHCAAAYDDAEGAAALAGMMPGKL